MRLLQTLRRIARDRRGSAAVEFALLGGFMIALLLAVLQVGIAMQQYNALRGVGGEVARYAVVQYQAHNELSNTQLSIYARSLATRPPYRLPADGMTVSIEDAPTQNVDGAMELRLQIQTQVTSMLGLVGLQDFYISYSRPIFIIINT